MDRIRYRQVGCPKNMPSAEIITIGTEILLGEIVDTNTRHIALTLRDLGVDIYRTTTIGDNIERIASAISEAMQRAEVIITTGGLGPTVDDPTREAVAQAAGVGTEFREDLWEQVVSTIARYGRKPSRESAAPGSRAAGGHRDQESGGHRARIHRRVHLRATGPPALWSRRK